MKIELDEKSAMEVIKKCGKCNLFKVEKIRGMNPMNLLQIGNCSVHEEVHFKDYSGFTINFDSRKCENFKER